MHSDWRPTGDLGGSRFPQWLLWRNPEKKPWNSSFRAKGFPPFLYRTLTLECCVRETSFRCQWEETANTAATPLGILDVRFFMCHPPNETRHVMDEVQSWGAGQLPGLRSWLPCSVTFGTLLNLPGPPVLYCRMETIHSGNNESSAKSIIPGPDDSISKINEASYRGWKMVIQEGNLCRKHLTFFLE